MALFVPEVQRTTRNQIGALTEHYGSPVGGLKEGENPSNFAIALEMLAVRADMGPIARLRLIRDRFVTGQDN